MQSADINVVSIITCRYVICNLWVIATPSTSGCKYFLVSSRHHSIENLKKHYPFINRTQCINTLQNAHHINNKYLNELSKWRLCPAWCTQYYYGFCTWNGETAIGSDVLKCIYTANFFLLTPWRCWPSTRKKSLRSVSVELEPVPIFLVSDTDIEATTNQRWTSEGPLANPHVSRVVIASQWRRSLCSS